MIAAKDIVVTGLQPWDIRMGSNCKNIALELSKRNRVLYVNAPTDRWTRFKDRKEAYIRERESMRRLGTGLRQLGERFWVLDPSRVIESIGWLPEGALFSSLNKVNNRRLAADIGDAIAKLAFKDIMLFNDSDMIRSFYLNDFLHPAASVYYSRDNLMAVPYWYKHGHVWEPLLMGKSGLVCANSAYLAGVARKYNRHAFDVGQGCDLSLFDAAVERAVPGDMRSLSRPVIGYIGAIISNRLDVGLLTELCRRRPDWNFVLVGKADEGFLHSELKGLPNVHFLGLKKEGELADYLAQFDVAINPQQLNELTIGNYPRKIDEYLALGKPVVATETETMELFRSHVYLGRTAEDYVRLIGRALEEGDEAVKAERMRFARSHTWEASVQAIGDAVRLVYPNY